MKGRIEREKVIVGQMIELYCRRREGNRKLCASCIELHDYALERLSLCPYGERKPSCRKCAIHCYKPVMKSRIQEVMRFAGPRMLLINPIATINHIIREIKS